MHLKASIAGGGGGGGGSTACLSFFPSVSIDFHEILYENHLQVTSLLAYIDQRIFAQIDWNWLYDNINDLISIRIGINVVLIDNQLYFLVYIKF